MVEKIKRVRVEVPVNVTIEVEVEDVEDDVSEIGGRAIDKAIGRDNSALLERLGNKLSHKDPRDVNILEMEMADGTIEYPD